MFFRSFARNNARQCLWEIIPYLECHTIAKPSGREIESACPSAALCRRNPWRIFCSGKPVFGKLLEVDFRLISDQDVKTKIGCRWELL